jgi:RimJ/RimL family protein N-acetyltransferase
VRGRPRKASSDDVTLRDVTEDDLEILFEQQRDPVANEAAAFPARERGAFMAHWAKILKDGSLVKKAVVFRGHLAGNVVSFERSGVREIGYWIGREYWGRGIATLALSRLLREVKERPIYAHVATHNVPSIRVLEKCGFTPSAHGAESGGPPDDGVEEVVLELTEAGPRAMTEP